MPKPVVQIYYACFNKRVRCVAWQQNKHASPDFDNICFQFMNFISGSVPPFAVTWTNHMQKLFQSASLSAVTSYYSARCLAKVHLPFEEHPKILVASNCITWRRLMAPVKTAGPQNGLCWRQVLLLQVIRHVSDWNLLSTKWFSDSFKPRRLASPNTPRLPEQSYISPLIHSRPCETKTMTEW